MASITQLLERNKEVKHTPFLLIDEREHDAKVDFSRTLIVTCCDPRCTPEEIFNFKSGEVIVHRNAGANVRYALRDIVILDTVMQLTEILILHHTDCGTLRHNDEELKTWVKHGNWVNRGIDEKIWPEVDKIDIGLTKDVSPEDTARDNIEWVRAQPVIRDELKKNTRGFVFDIKSGNVKEIVV
ncbi:carbonic anhydrase [Podospora didyma]|uniref:Carbonic anhydrase n=1 Tax=Podospora didyma TaxID=330526 RepID=A0AAE0N4M7_9PEZI|nr:carbonic anhydrase [Podospora didyma]